MNIVYKVIFNRLTGAFQAVSELATGGGKQSRAGRRAHKGRNQHRRMLLGTVPLLLAAANAYAVDYTTPQTVSGVTQDYLSGDTITVPSTSGGITGLLVNNGGSSTATNVSVSVGGTESKAAAATGAGSVLNILGGNYSTTGNSTAGAPVIGASTGGVVNIGLDPNSGAGTTISSTGNSTNAVLVTTGAATINGAAISTTGTKSAGLGVSAGNSTINMTNGSVTTSGNDSDAVVASGGNNSITLNNVNVTTTGTGTINTGGARGLVAGGTSGGKGSTITMNGGSISTTNNNPVTFSYAVEALSGGVINLNDTVISTVGNGAHGMYIVFGGQMNATGVQVSTQGPSATAVFANGGTLGLNGNSTIRTTGTNSFGVAATNSGKITGNATVDITTQGTGAYGVYATTSGTINLGSARVTTNGANTSGLLTNGPGSQITISGATNITRNGNWATFGGAIDALNGGKITLSPDMTVSVTRGNGGVAAGISMTAANSDVGINGGNLSVFNSGAGFGAAYAIAVTNGANKTFDGSAGNILPNVVLNGPGRSYVLETQSSSTLSTMTLAGNTALNMGMTPDAANGYGALASPGGLIAFTGNSSSGGTQLEAGGGQLQFNGNSDLTGSRVSVYNVGTSLGNVDISNHTGPVSIGSLDSVNNGLNALQTTGTVNLGTNTLIIGANNAANNGSLRDNANYAGAFTGTGSLVKVGSLNQILSGTGNTVNSVDIQGGTLTFAQNGNFTVTGDLTVHGGATLGIGDKPTTVVVGGAFNQQSGSTLNAILGASPDIQATNAMLNGALTIAGFNAGPQPFKASDVTSNRYTLMTTTGGITGNFNNVNSADGGFIANDNLDYLNSYGFVTNAGKNYELGFDMAWTTTRDDHRTGSFTMAAGTAFDVDTPLSNQTASSFTGWDGTTLTKNGDGLLQLSAANTYTGATTVNGGVLKLSGAGDIATSSAVVVNGGQLDVSQATGNRTLNNLSGAGGEIVLGGKTLTLNNTQNGTFAGDFDASTGSLIKQGAGTLTLSGNTAYTGDTQLQAGALVLDGSNGKAQLVSNVIGQSGTSLSLVKGAQLTGTIDPTDVTIDSASRWNMTGNSSVGTLTLAGTVALSNPGAMLTQGRVLTATNLVGQGGTIKLYSALGGNASVTDKIVIDGGSASGHTTLAVQNAGGLGDQTTGNGINVVHTINGATTTADAFNLGTQKLMAGAFEYGLYKGGEDWFLRSQYRAEVNLYASAPRLAMDWGNASIGSLYEREGDRASMGNADRTVWSRVVGQHGEYAGGTNGLQGNAPKSQGDLSFVQIGGDLYNWKPMAEVSARAGVFGTIGSSSDSVDNVTGAGNLGKAGTVNMDHYAVGAYATTQSSSGWYTDSVFQLAQQHLTTSSVNNVGLGSTGNSYAASFEFGKRTDLGNNWMVEPQAQLSWQHQKFDDAADRASAVRFDGADSMLLRLGVRFARTLGTEQDKLIAWFTPSVVNDFGSATSVRLPTPTQGDAVVNVSQGSTRLRLVGGVDGAISKSWSVSGKLGYEYDMEADYTQTSLQATANYRY